MFDKSFSWRRWCNPDGGGTKNLKGTWNREGQILLTYDIETDSWRWDFHSHDSLALAYLNYDQPLPLNQQQVVCWKTDPEAYKVYCLTLDLTVYNVFSENLHHDQQSEMSSLLSLCNPGQFKWMCVVCIHYTSLIIFRWLIQYNISWYGC